MKFSILISSLILFYNYDIQAQEANSSIQLIVLNGEIMLHWDNTKSEIVDDELWEKSKKLYSKNRRFLIQEVSNKERTKAEVCEVKGKLSKGQMAFIVLDQMEEIPYAMVFGYRYCLVYPNCPYIAGLVESIDDNPNASSQLMEFLSNQKKKK